MRQRGWIRVSVLWVAPLLLAVVVLVWARSDEIALVIEGPGTSFADIDRGRVHVGLWTEIDPGERLREVRPYPNGYLPRVKFEWGFEYQWNRFYKWIAIPLWFPAGLLLIAAGLGWRSETASRRRSAGSCAKCGYSREGIAGSAACPECGVS